MRNILASAKQKEDIHVRKTKAVRKRTSYINKYIIGTYRLFLSERTQLEMAKKKTGGLTTCSMKGKIVKIPRTNVRSYYTIEWEPEDELKDVFKIKQEQLQNRIESNNRNKLLLKIAREE